MSKTDRIFDWLDDHMLVIAVISFIAQVTAVAGAMYVAAHFLIKYW